MEPVTVDSTGALAVRVGPFFLRVRTKATPAESLAEASDDGVGVDASAIGTLFNRYAHGLSHTATAGRERCGIGLALVREIAVAHRGDVDVTETPGGGATSD
jgi:signal transduction histidine kinase